MYTVITLIEIRAAHKPISSSKAKGLADQRAALLNFLDDINTTKYNKLIIYELSIKVLNKRPSPDTPICFTWFASRAIRWTSSTC